MRLEARFHFQDLFENPSFFILIVVRWGNLVLNLNNTFWLIGLSALIAYILVMNRFHGEKLQAN